MILEGDNSHAFIYLFIHSFQKKKKSLLTLTMHLVLDQGMKKQR